MNFSGGREIRQRVMVKRLLLIAALGGLVACEKPQAPADPAAPTEQPEVAPTEAEPAEPAEPAASGTSENKPSSALADDLAAGETKLYGARFTIIEEPMTLAAAIEKSAEGPGPYKIDATMSEVCTSKGCWFALAGEGIDRPVRVKMKDYGFFVPRNAKGARAIVEGELTAREMSAEEAKHYAEDAGKTPEEVAKIGATKVYEFTATAVEVTMPQG